VRTPVAPPFHVPTYDQRGMVSADMGIELDLGPRRRGIEPHQMTVTDQRLAVEVMIGPVRAQQQEFIVRLRVETDRSPATVGAYVEVGQRTVSEPLPGVCIHFPYLQ